MRRYWAAVFGNILEHYDQALYGFLIPFLAPLFFPHADPIYSLLLSFALLPLGTLSRPLGAYVFGQIGDRWGRARSLSLTLFGMALATSAMGCLPEYEQAGWISPALLMLGRLTQNFFCAGEKTSGALFLLEQTKQEKRPLMSSLFDASGIAGILLAAVAAALFGMHWRWLFWAGGLCGMAGLFIRRDSSFALPKQDTKLKWADAKPIAWIALVSGYSYANYYLLTNFLNAFLPLISQVDVNQALALNTVLLTVDLALLPFFGWLGSRWNKESLMITAAMTGACLSLPLFLMLDGATAWIAACVRIAFTVIGVCLAAPYHAWAMEVAPKERRLTVCAVGSALGGRAIGAPMPMIALWLYHKTGWTGSPACLLIAFAVFAGAAVGFSKLKKTATASF